MLWQIISFIVAVFCGGHYREDCGACPFSYGIPKGKSWCHGFCKWVQNNRTDFECLGENSMSPCCIPMVSIYLIPYKISPFTLQNAEEQTNKYKEMVEKAKKKAEKEKEKEKGKSGSNWLQFSPAFLFISVYINSYLWCIIVVKEFKRWKGIRPCNFKKL